MHTIDLVIVGDDNALTQETIETAKRYAPDGVQVNSILVPFQGYNKSLNEGAKQGSADIIGFLNNDLHFHENWFDPIRFNRCDHVFLVFGGPDCDAGHGQVLREERGRRDFA